MLELQQETIDTVVAGTLDGNLSKDVLDKFIATASLYEEPFSGGDGISQHGWLRYEDAPDRLEVMAIRPFYGEHEIAVEFGFPEERSKILIERGCLSDEDYKKALRFWVGDCYNFGNELFFLHYMLATLHEMKSSDGRNCIVLEALTEGGQGGWEFGQVFYGCYTSPGDAMAFLKSKGIADPYTEDEVEQYLSEVIRINT